MSALGVFLDNITAIRSGGDESVQSRMAIHEVTQAILRLQVAYDTLVANAKWNYNLSEAPTGMPILVSFDASGERDIQIGICEKTLLGDAFFNYADEVIRGVYAWRSLPQVAPFDDNELEHDGIRI